MSNKKTTTEKEIKSDKTKPVVDVAKTAKVSKVKVSNGTLYIRSTYNNTLMTLTDKNGNALFSSSSGAMGFKGAKKGTPFASAKIAEFLADKAISSGMKEIDVVVKGVGAGRESGIRTFASKGMEISAIRDVTPVPHNGPKPKKPRRV
ncbi:MAG: 30S ribosomal protein S11 [Patescibacteria group bacterium]